MTLSDLSIRRPVFAWMLMFALMIFGYLCYTRMGVSLMPDVDFPTVSVSIGLDGAAPDIMESQVADVVEGTLSSIEGVKEISATCRQGSATITAEFEVSRNIDLAVQDVQAKLAQAVRTLPRDINPPVVSKTNPEDQPIMWLALYGDVPPRDMMIYADDYVKGRLQTVDGVGDIFLGGLIPRNLRVWLDLDRMAAKQITAQDVMAAIQREHAEVPAGALETPSKQWNVRMLGEIKDPAEFGRLLITQRGGQRIQVPIALGAVARIEDGLSDTQRISRVDGKRSVGFGIRKQRGSNTVEVARGVKARLAELSKSLPAGMKLAVVFDSSSFVEASAGELKNNLILSALLTGFVCWLFLGTFSSTLNVLLAIPTSVLGTFIVLYFGKFTLNTFTLLGLTLAIGIVVDDAIMMLENIVRHREHGEDRVTASIRGAREITFAATVASIAILAIFLPVVFMKGILGKFFFHFGITISVAVMFSLLEALTLTPMRTSQFLQVGGRNPILRASNAVFGWLAGGYRVSLAFALRWRWSVVGLALAAFALSVMVLVPRLKKEFVPPQDQSRFLVRLMTPPGSSLAFTSEKVKLAEEWILAQPALAHYFVAIGGFQGGEVNSGNMFVTMKDPPRRPKGATGKPLSQAEFMGIVRKQFNSIPGLKVFMQDLSIQGFSASRGFPVEYSVRGPDWERLVKGSMDFKTAVEQSKLAQDVDSDYQTGMPEVQVVPDRAKAYARGVSIQSIGDAINAFVGGVRIAQFTQNGHRYDIRVRAEEKYRLQREDIAKFFVRNQSGELVSLADVVKVVDQPTLLTITRKNRERAIGIFANPAAGRAQADVLDQLDVEATRILPQGYRAVRTGAAAGFGDAVTGLAVAMILGILIAYMVLGSQFNSFIHPFTVLLALPFAAMGALLGLFVTGYSLNIYSGIGIILLMGIVKKNSILLVDFTNQKRREGLPVREALLAACPIRLRPILMTSIATIAAAVPPALGFGAGAELRIPMAIAVIGGVAVSTFLTLFVVPCAYVLFSWWERFAFLDPGRRVAGIFEPGAGGDGPATLVPAPGATLGT